MSMNRQRYKEDAVYITIECYSATKKNKVLPSAVT